MNGGYGVMPFIIFGGIFSVIGTAVIVARIRLRRVCTTQTAGIVSDLKIKVSETTDTDDRGHTRTTKNVTYAPVFQYYADGRQITKESSVSSGARFEVGSRITLFYNPNNVEEYYVLEEKAARYVGFIFLLVGVLFIFVGLFG